MQEGNTTVGHISKIENMFRQLNDLGEGVP